MALTNCEYKNYPLPSVELFPDLIKNTKGLKGLNVTVPYKEKVIPYLDKLNEIAQKTGAVNCIRFDEKGTTGFNTDVTGFENSLKPLLEKHHINALVLGTGGAAKAVAFVLTRLGISFQYVSRKNIPGHYTYMQLNEQVIKDHPLIINTTPLGTTPDVQLAPDIPYEYLNEFHLLYDLVYNPAETLFLKKGKEHGAKTKNGYEMLELQAEASWEIWNK